MKKKILVDMDGVLADVYAQFTALEFEESGIRLEPEDLYGRLEERVFPSFHKHVNSLGFFRTVPLIEGSVKGLKYLNEKYEVLIVSSATEFNNCMNDKRKWLMEYFPFISWKQMIFCGSKENIHGDIMIDDHPKNLYFFEGRRILFTQPHNVYIHDSSYERVFRWEDIVKTL